MPYQSLHDHPARSDHRVPRQGNTGNLGLMFLSDPQPGRGPGEALQGSSHTSCFPTFLPLLEVTEDTGCILWYSFPTRSSSNETKTEQHVSCMGFPWMCQMKTRFHPLLFSFFSPYLSLHFFFLLAYRHCSQPVQEPFCWICFDFCLLDKPLPDRDTLQEKLAHVYFIP